MQTTLRAIKLLMLVIWLGGLIFFGAVLAPVAFTRLPSTHMAGMVVGTSLSILHIIGLVCGVIFIGAAFVLHLIAKFRKPRISAQIALIGIMLVITAVSQFRVIPRMEDDRAQIAAITGSTDGDISAVPPDSPARVDFNHMHVLSTRLEEVVMLCGLIVLVLVARPDDAS